jgi:N-acetylmuramoyl-L-alanine amidase
MGCQVISFPLKKPALRGLAVLITALAVGLLSVSMPTAMAGPSITGEARVAIDAGHGGADTGAQGPTGLLEKTVALELARTLATVLEPEYQVTLTRGDDYQLPLHQRTAIANSAEADLFISLHTGAAFQHSTRGVTLYYHTPIQKSVPPDSNVGYAKETAQPWHTIQNRHRAASLKFAEAIRDAMIASDTAAECRILSAPLPLLEGADMPAVLVEVGPITNPAIENVLSSKSGIDQLARALRLAIAEYIKQSVARMPPNK